MSSFRPSLRKHHSSPGNSAQNIHHASNQQSNDSTGSSSPILAPAVAPPLLQHHSSGHISIQLPDEHEHASHGSSNLNSSFKRTPRSRPTSGTFSPEQIHSAMHRVSISAPSGGGGHGHGGSRDTSLSMSRTSTQNSAGEGRYRRKVGFEAFEAGPAALFAYTCQAKSEGYKRGRSTRVFAVAVSPDEAGQDALDWLMSELVEDGDEVVAIRIIELDDGERHHADAQEALREDAHQLLQTILEKNNEADDRRISVIVEFVAGKITEMLLKMIALYRPDSLVVGTRGTRSKLHQFGRALGAPGMGSVSRFAVSHSPIPVIVVRPERKVKKTLEKRQNNPKRGQYAALVGPNGLELSRSRSRERSIGGTSDKEM